MRQKLEGHPKVHAGYTHHDIKSIRPAVDKLPGSHRGNIISGFIGDIG